MEYHQLLYQGLLHGDSLLQDNRYMKLLNQLFPNCYILNREGRVFFSPELTPEQNKNNQTRCLEAIPEQEGWRKDNANNTIERLLSSAIQATEENTRTSAINEQAQTIKSVEKAKTLEQETQKSVEER